MAFKDRLGFVRISKAIITDENVEILHLVFSKFIPIFSYDEGSVIAYKGLSSHFDEVKEGDEIPKYDAMVEKSIDLTNNDNFRVYFKKIV